jgi:putative modified peptide
MSHPRLDLTEARLKELLEKLSGDDSFRKQFTDDPAKALEAYGIHLPTDALPRDIVLPPKEAFGSLLQALETPGVMARAYLSFVLPQGGMGAGAQTYGPASYAAGAQTYGPASYAALAQTYGPASYAAGAQTYGPASYAAGAQTYGPASYAGGDQT